MVLWKTIPKLWDGGECWIIGGGPSVPRQFGVPEEEIRSVMEGEKPPSIYSPYMKAIHDCHVIGINNAYKIGNWIDVHFFGDSSWYLQHHFPLAKWAGIKITCCTRFANRAKEQMEGVRYLEKDREHKFGISKNRRCVSWNNNSGAAAISVARHFGVKRIILLGFDMSLDGSTGKSHWHGSHEPYGDKKSRSKKERRPPPFKRHMKGWPYIAKDAEAMGIEIINASPISIIEEFPKAMVKDILDGQRTVQFEKMALVDRTNQEASVPNWS